MARRPDSTLAWFATGLVVLSFPFAARATFDEYTGEDAGVDAVTEDAPIENPTTTGDSGMTSDTPGAEPSTTFTNDSGGISCAVHRSSAADGSTTNGIAGIASIGAACALAVRRRRRVA